MNDEQDISVIDPIRVHVVLDDTQKESPRVVWRASERTTVLNASNQFEMIASYDPMRDEVRITVSDNPIVVSRSRAQACDTSNTSGTLANPNGRLIANGANEYSVRGSNEVWISAAVYPTRVGYEIVRIAD